MSFTGNLGRRKCSVDSVEAAKQPREIALASVFGRGGMLFNMGSLTLNVVRNTHKKKILIVWSLKHIAAAHNTTIL